MLCGWVISRTSPAEVFVDLAHAQLTSDDGETLARALQTIPTLTSVDVRGNPGLAGAGLAALIQAMKDEKPGHPRSLCGVSPHNTRLEVPRRWGEEQQVDIELTVAELECHLYAESVTAGMGGKASNDSIMLNRRGGGGASDKGGWYPLIWAAKVDHLQVGEQLIKNGCNVNQQEAAGSHSQKFTALHMACSKGHEKFVRMLLKEGADPTIQDINGSPAKAIAEKRGNKEIVALVTAASKKRTAAPRE